MDENADAPSLVACFDVTMDEDVLLLCSQACVSLSSLLQCPTSQAKPSHVRVSTLF
jgi:hypothetical protein